MQNFITIKQAAQELGVNEGTVARWELKDTQPNPEIMERVQAFVTAHCPEVPVENSSIFLAMMKKGK